MELMCLDSRLEDLSVSASPGNRSVASLWVFLEGEMFLSTVRINDLSFMAGRLHLDKFSSVEFQSWRVPKYSSRSIRSGSVQSAEMEFIVSID